MQSQRLLRHRARTPAWTIVLASALLMPACELTEVTTADARDVVIAEVVLRTESRFQIALLHRTDTNIGSALVPDAKIVVRNENTGEEIVYQSATSGFCFDAPQSTASEELGSCYVARVDEGVVRAGGRYRLRIELPDGRVMAGATQVPGDFAITRPEPSGPNDARICALAPRTAFEIAWTQSDGAAVYLMEVRMQNLLQALREAGMNVEGDRPVELEGLSVTSSDTTLLFPSELGLFNRFDNDALPILLGIRDGLPPEVTSSVVVAAADRNYVNWVRGGNFNPSGLVQSSSIDGDGAGVFGSLVAHSAVISTASQSSFPPCQ